MKFLMRLARYILSNELDNLNRVINSQEAEIDKLKEPKRVIANALPRETFVKFRERFERPIVTSATTAEQAGYLVGVQRVLTELERDHVAA